MALETLAFYALSLLTFAVIGASMADKREMNKVVGFFLGFLGPIGWAVIALTGNLRKDVPPGSLLRKKNCKGCCDKYDNLW